MENPPIVTIRCSCNPDRTVIQWQTDLGAAGIKPATHSVLYGRLWTVALRPASGLWVSLHAPAGDHPKGGGRLNALFILGSVASIVGLALMIYYEHRHKEK